MVEIPLYAYTLFGLTESEAGFSSSSLTLRSRSGRWSAAGWPICIGCRITAVLGFLVAAAGYLLVSRWPIDPALLDSV